MTFRGGLEFWRFRDTWVELQALFLVSLNLDVDPLLPTSELSFFRVDYLARVSCLNLVHCNGCLHFLYCTRMCVENNSCHMHVQFDRSGRASNLTVYTLYRSSILAESQLFTQFHSYTNNTTSRFAEILSPDEGLLLCPDETDEIRKKSIYVIDSEIRVRTCLLRRAPDEISLLVRRAILSVFTICVALAGRQD